MNLQPRTVSAEIPTSSLADVAFLLIVFFLITMTFAATRGLDMALPKENDEPRLIDTQEAIYVEVGARGRLRVDGESLTLSGLLAHLEPKLLLEPGKPVIVQAADATPYGPMVDVLDELRQGRHTLGLAEEINIALPTERERQMYWPG
ncbi:MAG: ExbD/TolR family protein [Thermoanaerobaculia bacterium]